MKNIITLLLAAFLCTSALAQVRGKTNQLTPYPWLETLSAQEQRAAIVLYMIALNENFKNLLSNSKSKQDELWALKVNACGTLFGAQLATKNSDQHETLKKTAFLIVDVIQGKSNQSESQRRIREAREEGSRMAESISDSVVNSLKTKHAKELAELNSRMIVAAMQCASDGKKNN